MENNGNAPSTSEGMRMKSDDYISAWTGGLDRVVVRRNAVMGSNPSAQNPRKWLNFPRRLTSEVETDNS